MNPRPFSVLLVSADRALLRQLTRFLELFGYEVRQAVSPHLAQAAAEAAGADFLLVDSALTPQLGPQFCRTIRQHAQPAGNNTAQPAGNNTAPSHYTYALLLIETPDVADLTAALEAGFDDFLARPVVFGELLARLRAGARVIEFERRLAQQGGIEPVTGLPDAHALAARLKEHLQRAAERSHGESLGSLSLIDLDSFSRIRGKFGALIADKLLRTAGELLQGSCNHGEVAAALEGDCFAVLLPGSTEEQAAQWSQAFLATLAEHEFEVGPEKCHLTASSGVVELSRGLAAERTLELAAGVLALAKDSGRNCVLTQLTLTQETEAWNALAAGGKLFATTTARDVMIPCPLLLGLDETLDQAQELLAQTRLGALPVVDHEGKFAGLLTVQQSERRARPAKGRSSPAPRLVRHVMTTDVPRFDELTSLGELMEFFTGGSSTLAVILRDQRPSGLVFCQSLAALNERLSREQFAPAVPFAPSSEFLMVPDLTTMDAE